MRAMAVLVGVVVCASVAFGQEAGKKDFVVGLDHLANERWSEAQKAFAGAVAADDENAVYYLHLGVGATMSGDAATAKSALARARKLDGKNPDAEVWDYARRMMYEPTAFAGSPPYRKTKYAATLIDNAIFYGPENHPDNRAAAWKKICAVAKEFGWAQLGKGGAQPVMKDRVIELYKAGKWQECLDLINNLRAAGPIDAVMFGYSAHCKLGLGDYQAGREEYTVALRALPLTAGYLIGRAQCCAKLGAFRDGVADFDLARQIDPSLVEKYPKDEAFARDGLKAGQQATSSPADLWKQLKQSAADGKPDAELTALADQLYRSRGGDRYVRDEEYTRELTRLFIPIGRDENNADAQVAIAAFLCDPTVTRKVSLPNVDATARIPVGSEDPNRALNHISAALKINPKHTGAMEQMAIAQMEMRKPDEMIKWVHQALDAGALTLDLAAMHLDYYTTLANNLNAQAADLRTPKVRFEDRHEGNQIVTYRITTNPTAADLARADELDRQAKLYRDKAKVPIETLAGKLKDSQLAQDRVVYCLANAHYYLSTNNFGQSVAAAQAALKIDPYCLDALTFLIDLCPKVGQQALAIQYQDQLNNMANPSSGRTLDQIWPQLKQTRFKGAKEQLARAEQIDPGSPHIAFATFAIAQEQQKSDDMQVSGRIVLAMERARVKATGRSLADKEKSPLLPDDAISAAYVLCALANLHNDATRFVEAQQCAEQVVRLCSRVPVKGWPIKIPETIVPTNPGEFGTDLRGLYAYANRLCANKLIAQEKYDQAISHLVALQNMDPPDSQVTAIGYDIYRVKGFAPFRGKLPDGMVKVWEMMAHREENDRQFGRVSGEPVNAELASIDAQINKIDRAIAHGVGSAELAELESKKAELLKKREALQQSSPRRRGR